MTKRNAVFAGGSILTAVAAVGLGAFVSSGAMASPSQDTTLTASMITFDENGEAYECTIDATLLPTGLPVGGDADVVVDAVEATPFEVPEGDLPTIVEGDVTDLEGVVQFEVEVASSGVVVGAPAVGEAGEPPIGEALPMAVGSTSVDGVTEAFTIDADGEAHELEVRPGTEEECAAIAEDVTFGEAIPAGGEGLVPSTEAVENGS